MAPTQVLEDAADLVRSHKKTNIDLTFNINSLHIDPGSKLVKVLTVSRCLMVDLCEQLGGGHPDGTLSMAAIGIALWKHVMRDIPSQTTVLQQGSMRPVGWPHLACCSHPEIKYDGIEVTTGPLSQGVGNAVGLAMATKNLAATHNQPGYDMADNMTWCMVGDACLQDGVALEAIQVAGHWR